MSLNVLFLFNKQRYSVYYRIKLRKAANPLMKPAETSKCLAFLLEKLVLDSLYYFRLFVSALIKNNWILNLQLWAESCRSLWKWLVSQVQKPPQNMHIFLRSCSVGKAERGLPHQQGRSEHLEYLRFPGWPPDQQNQHNNIPCCVVIQH